MFYEKTLELPSRFCEDTLERPLVKLSTDQQSLVKLIN